MATKSTLLNWLNAKLEGISKEEDADHLKIECSLVRAFSEYRDKEISKLCMEKDFEKRLLNRLEHIDLEVVETYTFENRTRYNFPIGLSIGFAVVVVIVSVTFYNSESNANLSKAPAHVTPIEFKSNSFTRVNNDEEALILELRNNPNNIRLLERLENYYVDHGKKEQATEIHYMLETVSKKY